MITNPLLKAFLSTKGCIFLLFMLFNYSLTAQQIDNVRFEQQDKKIAIYYDLAGGDTPEEFNVEIYCSTDGGTTWGQPLQKVAGEIGANQIPGKSKKIVWDVLAEREKLVSNIIFEVVAHFASRSGVFTDNRDGHTYKWVKIGNQIWMAENLAFLPKVSPPTLNSKFTAYCYVFGYNGSNVSEAKATVNYSKYGVLYNWPAAVIGTSGSHLNPSGVQGICSNGWHIPSDAEWQQLIHFVSSDGHVGTEGNALKSKSGWNSVGTSTDNYYFSVLPVGYRSIHGFFLDVGGFSSFWSASISGSVSAWCHRFYFDRKNVDRTNVSRDYGFSVRCVRDP
jgi:uncharacterized protein (TIGR02145 family)